MSGLPRRGNRLAGLGVFGAHVVRRPGLLFVFQRRRFTETPYSKGSRVCLRCDLPNIPFPPVRNVGVGREERLPYI
jgi:hypothetical protein